MKKYFVYERTNVCFRHNVVLTNTQRHTQKRNVQLQETKATTAMHNLEKFNKRASNHWREIAAFVVAPLTASRIQ